MPTEIKDKGRVGDRIAENYMHPLVIVREGDNYRICAKDEFRHCLVDLTDEITQQIKR
jgi:hypothetical protein